MRACTLAARSTRVLRLRLGLVALACSVILLGIGAARAAADVDLSDGTLTGLTDVVIGNELNCDVNHADDSVGEFYGETACATEVSFDGELYGPSSIPAGNAPTAYAQVSQGARTGSGSAADPYTVVTVVDAVPAAGGDPVARITQTDRYVTGDESYRTTISVQNLKSTTATGHIYHGGDCYLQDSDTGYGRVDGEAVACVNAIDDGSGTGTTAPGSRIEQFLPLSPDSSYYEAGYSEVWSAMDAQTAFPDTCRCNEEIDNGAGLSWSFTLAPSATKTVTLLTTFSPAGNQPLTTAKTADEASTVAGGTNGYTITVSNPNGVPATLTSISDTLPAGFSYVPGSTTGATTSNPSIAGQALTWNGSFNVPANGSATLSFDVTVASSPGQYFNNATAEAGSTTVLPTGDTASITVTEPGITVSTNDATVDPEGNSGTTNATFTVTLSESAPGDVTVDYATVAGTATAGADYTTTSDTLTFTSGDTSETVSVPVAGDTLDEPDETYELSLSNPSSGATVTGGTGLGTIVDDDDPPSLSIDDVSRAEGDSGAANATFTVTLGAASGKTVTVGYSTAAGTATAGTDYTGATGTLTFLPGETSKQVAVPVLGDLVDEADETFTVGLASPTNATIADAQGAGTITDDDAAPSISAGDVSKAEGDSGSSDSTVTATLSHASAFSVTVDYATVAGTASAGEDYTSATGTLTFAPGQTSRPIAVGILGDTLDEPDETLTVGLSNPGNASIADASAIVTILDDDEPAPVPVVPAISIGDVTVNPEGHSGTTPAMFAVTLSAPTTVAVSVTAATADGTATAPADYTAVSGPVTFAPGETSKTVTVLVVGDTLDEPDETFRVGLSAPSNATIGDGAGVGTILDDDLPEIDVPGGVDGSDLFCGAQRRGKCTGLKFKAEFDRPGNASWTFGAYGTAGKGAGAAAKRKPVKLGTVRRAIAQAGTVRVKFKLKPGKQTKRLLRTVKRRKLKTLRIKQTFVPTSGATSVRTQALALRLTR